MREIWKAARAAGLAHIGISNHCDPMNRNNQHIGQTKQEIAALGLSDVVKQGVELNISGSPADDGASDLFLPAEAWKDLDYVNMGEHIFFSAMGGFLVASIKAGDWGAVDEYYHEKTALIKDAFHKYPGQAGPHPPAHAVWVHPWLWETQNGVFLLDRVFDFTAPLLEIMCNRGIAFEVNGFLFRSYDFPARPLLQLGSFDDHYAALVQYYVALLARIRTEYPDLAFTLGSDAHKMDEIGDLFMPRLVLRKAGIPISHVINL